MNKRIFNEKKKEEKKKKKGLNKRMSARIGILPTMHGRDSSGQDYPTITYFIVVSDKQPCMFRDQFKEEKDDK